MTSKLDGLIDRENARVTFEWERYERENGNDELAAIELAERQGARFVRLMDGLGYRPATKEEMKQTGCGWVWK